MTILRDDGSDPVLLGVRPGESGFPTPFPTSSRVVDADEYFWFFEPLNETARNDLWRAIATVHDLNGTELAHDYTEGSPLGPIGA